MSIDLLSYLACAVALVAAGSRVWTTRGLARRGEIWLLCVGGALVALAALLLAPSTTSLLSRVRAHTGVDAVKLLGDALRMAGAGAAGLLATRIRDDRAPSTRQWVRGLLVVEVVLVGTFIAAGFRSSDNGSAVRADPGFGIAYDSIRLVYPILALGLFIVAIWPYARGLPSGPARAGSRILVGAALVGIAWSSWTVDDILSLAHVGRQNTGDDAPSVALEIAFVVAAGTGMTVTVWDRLVHLAGGWLRAVRSYRAMAPLWHALCDPRVPAGSAGGSEAHAVPGAPAGLADRLAVRPWRASIARYRRVIEIRDAQLALRPFQAPAIQGGPHRSAQDEADDILAGLAAYAAGSQVDDNADPAASWVAVPATHDSIDAEAQWLAAVALAFVAARAGARPTRSAPAAAAR